MLLWGMTEKKYPLAVLWEALEELVVLGERGMKPDYNEWITFHDKVAQVARSALGQALVTDDERPLCPGCGRPMRALTNAERQRAWRARRQLT